MASNTPDKKAEPSSRAIVHKTTARNTTEPKRLKPQNCGFQYYEIGCGGGNDFLGSVYACNAGDVLFAKMSTFDQYCGG
ncbi:hypothetical protein [Hymenobacter psoromatis]|nr:hypothetical protein [Hymenobacter psoromatis]